MKSTLYLILLFLLLGCSARNSKLTESGEAMFRISYNYYDSELTDAELDSLQKSKPIYCETGVENEFYTLLVRKGLVSDDQLDTSALDLHPLSLENTHVHFSEPDFNLETNKAGFQYLNIKAANGETFKIDLGPIFIGDRWLSFVDLNDDGKLDMLLLEKYYIMRGDNFELKYYPL